MVTVPVCSIKTITLGINTFYTFRITANPNTKYWVRWYTTDSAGANILRETTSGYSYNDSDCIFYSSGNHWVRADVYSSDPSSTPYAPEGIYRWCVTVGQPNSPPTPPGPISASSVGTTTATINWGASSDPDGDSIIYAVYYKKASSGAWIAAGTTTSTSRPIGGLSADCGYGIRVYARDGKGGEAWREVAILFNTMAIPGTPGTPDLSAFDDTGDSSSDNITNQTSGLAFSWVPSIVNDYGLPLAGYEYRLDSGPWTPTGNGTIPSVRPPSLGDGGHKIYVRAYDNAQPPNYSASSSALSFRVDAVAPGPATQSSPVNGGTCWTLQPTMKWGRASDGSGSGISRYHLEVVENAPPYSTKVDKDVTGTSYTLSSSEALEWENSYVWRLWAIDVAGNSGTPTTEWEFSPYQLTMLAPPVTFIDSDGDLVTIALTGPGRGSVTFGANRDVSRIDLYGTTTQSSLTIGAKALVKGAIASARVGSIDTNGGPLGKIVAPTTDLCGEVKIGSSADPKASVSMVFDQIVDGYITSGVPIRSITVTEWTNTPGSPVEHAVAPWIGTITTTGRKANSKAVPPVEALAGDFSAGLVLSGLGVPAKGTTLGTVKIAGSIAGTTWSIDGDAGAVAVAGAVTDWTFQGGGANGVGLRAIKTLTLGDVQNATILAGGALGAVKALNWNGGAIAADSMVSLAVIGRKAALGVAALPGDFRNADLTLRANTVPVVGKATITALGSATIAGSLVGSTWSVDMDAGAITAVGGVSGWTLAGVGDGDPAELLSVKSLTLGDVTSANVTIRATTLDVTNAKGQKTPTPVGGVLGAVRALRWAAGTIQADSLASLAITGRNQTTTVSQVVGDFGATVTLLRRNVAASKPTTGSVTIAHDLVGSTWKVTGSMTTVTVARTALDSTVRASGSITSVSLGKSDGSTFLVGVTSDQLDPTQITGADLDPLATIGSLAIKGWTVPTGTASPDFLTDSSFLAPSMGTVSLLNATPGTWNLFAQTHATTPDLRIKRASQKDTRDPKNPGLNWTWTPGKPIPPGGVGRAHAITS